MKRSRFAHPLIRAAFCAVLLAMPLTSAWNLVAANFDSKLALKIGPRLSGVTRDVEVALSWSAITDGSFQRSVAIHVSDALALRPLLVRVNNEIRVQLFGDVPSEQIVRGTKGQLVEKFYLSEYCSRYEGQGPALAKTMIPTLLALQDHFHSRGKSFFYLVTPSKVAHMPEYFVAGRVCPSTVAARTELVAQYVEALKAAGIEVLDAATLIHSLRGRYDVDLFPQGGVHWNDLGGAIAAKSIVDTINRLAGRALVPNFTFTYKLAGVTSGADRELADLLNVFFPPLSYLTPKVSYQQPADCATDPARLIDAAIVGSSFSHLPGEIMIEHNCLANLNVYFYLRLSRSGGVPYRGLRANLKDSDLTRLREAEILILEENESFMGRGNYAEDLRRIVTSQP